MPAKPRPYGAQAALYDREYRAYVDDIPFYLARLAEHHVRGPLLELGVGTGRVALPLAAAGFTVVGIDRSEPMLRRARARRRELPRDVAARLRFSRKEMSSFSFPEPFAAVLVPFSSYALLADPAQRRACLACCRAALQPGGLLLIDLFAPSRGANPTPGVAQLSAPYTFRLPPNNEVVEKTTEELFAGDGRTVLVRYHYRRLAGATLQQRSSFVVEFSLALLGPAELELELIEAGFEPPELFGSYWARPYGPDAVRLIAETTKSG